jgi:trimethylamine-N-oxide reductase cytochrome c-type subunit TorC
VKATVVFATVLMLGLCIGAVFAPLRGAPAQRYTSAATPLLDGAAGKPIGSLGPAAALDIGDQSGSSTHVTLHGWFAAGSTAIVYSAPDKPIVALSGFTGHAVTGAAQAVTIDGWVATSALVDDVQTVWKTASALYAQKCGQCHALHPANAYSADQWPAVMKTQADNAALDPGQTALLTTYLQVQSARR